MNPLAIAKFFHIICEFLLVYFLAVGEVKGELLRLISNYFAMIETNRRKIFQFYFLV